MNTVKESFLIAENYYRYYKIFALSGIVQLHEGPVSWISPRRGEKGPSMAFCVRLSEENAERELNSIISHIQKGDIPRIWNVTPDSTPGNIVEIMKKNGFRDMGENAPAPEPAMLLYPKDFTPYTGENNPVVCRRITSREDFEAWVSVVNTALHGWEMIDAEHYYAWVEDGHIKIYLAEMEGTAVSTCATIQNGAAASLEFVSTLEPYRRRKAAISLCSYAVGELLENGAEYVTLSSCGDSVSLYQKLGFQTYFYDTMMKYNG